MKLAVLFPSVFLLTENRMISSFNIKFKLTTASFVLCRCSWTIQSSEETTRLTIHCDEEVHERTNFSFVTCVNNIYGHDSNLLCLSNFLLSASTTDSKGLEFMNKQRLNHKVQGVGMSGVYIASSYTAGRGEFSCSILPNDINY